MALSSDYIIKVAPGISATAAGVDADSVADKALVLSLIVGGVALLITYFTQRRTWRTPSPDLLTEWENKADKLGVTEGEVELGGNSPTAPKPEPVGDGGTATATIVRTEPAPEPAKTLSARVFAALVPTAYLAFIVYLLLGKFTELVPPMQGGDAAGIVGGIAAMLLFAACVTNDKRDFLESSSRHIIDGLVFAFKAMGIVLPIAGFFFIGNGDFSARILSLGEDAEGPALLFDLINAGLSHVAPNAFIVGFTVLFVGVIAGLEGSGFSGLPLTGSLSGALGHAANMDPATLAAIGQMGNIWSGGGTLVAWSSLVAVAGFARVPVLTLARKCFIPVMSGLILSTVFAILVF
jgi:hypothetical protein